ncbi:ATP-dependent Clp protease ATP-binding subunit ClpT1, chloroplastic-like protein [Tanacetum coccineum]
MFLRDKHKWKNPYPTRARRSRGQPIDLDGEPELFGDDPIPRPSGAPRPSKSHRSLKSSATSGSNKEQCKDLMQQQISIDRATKLEQIERETATRLEVSYAQIMNEDLKMLGTSIAAKLLRESGVTLFEVREETVKLLGKSDMYIFSPEHPPLTEPAQKAIDWAINEKLKSGETGEVTASHLLLGIWAQKESAGHKIMATLGFDDDKAQELAKSVNGQGYNFELQEGTLMNHIRFPAFIPKVRAASGLVFYRLRQDAK